MKLKNSMINRLHNNIFKNASKTYYYSSLFFPKEVRDDIFILYAFVRSADDLVDSISQNRKGFRKFVGDYEKELKEKKSKNIVIDSFVEMVVRKRINKTWINSFMKAMKSDLSKTNFKTIKETEDYIYGSADVIGLMMAKILNLPKESYVYAQALGKSMQLSNFIRDIQVDNDLNRCYFPQNELEKYNLRSLKFSEVSKKQKDYKEFMHFQINRYFKWQEKAELGFKYIPKKYRIAIKTASDMYKLTQQIIYKDPFIVYRKKVKPKALEVISRGILNTISS